MGRKLKLLKQNRADDMQEVGTLLGRKQLNNIYERYAFIQFVIKNKKAKSLTVLDLCKFFDANKPTRSKNQHLTPRGYFNWIKKGEPKFRNHNEQLAALIKSKQNPQHTNGARTIKLLLERDNNLIIGRRVVQRYMNNLNIAPIISRTKRGQSKKKLIKVFRITKNNIYFWMITKTKDGVDKEYCWNKLKVDANTQFDKIISKIVCEDDKVLPNQVYASDIMFLTEKKNGALQLFAIIDIITKKIVGYCYLAYKQDNFPIFAQCIRNTTKNKNLLIFQSDKGFEYTDARTKKIFIDNNIFQSFADKERSWQNGTIEGFFAQLNYRINLPALWFGKLSHDEMKNKVDQFITDYNAMIEYRTKKENIDVNKIYNNDQRRKLIENNILLLKGFDSDEPISYRDEYEFKRRIAKWLKQQTPDLLQQLKESDSVIKDYFEYNAFEIVRGLIK